MVILWGVRGFQESRMGDFGIAKETRAAGYAAKPAGNTKPPLLTGFIILSSIIAGSAQGCVMVTPSSQLYENDRTNSNIQIPLIGTNRVRTETKDVPFWNGEFTVGMR